MAVTMLGPCSDGETSLGEDWQLGGSLVPVIPPLSGCYSGSKFYSASHREVLRVRVATISERILSLYLFHGPRDIGHAGAMDQRAALHPDPGRGPAGAQGAAALGPHHLPEAALQGHMPPS